VSFLNMRKGLIVVVVAVLALAGVVVYNRSEHNETQPGQAARADGGQGRGGAAGGRGVRPPMPVEFATVKRSAVSERVLVVGNLIGAATVEIVPKVNGRLQSVAVKLGDPVRRGQMIAKVEDFEIREQVRQAEASYQVAQASIRQREADLKLAQTNLDRSRSLYERQLLPQQTYDDTEARYQAALAQVDLTKAQFEQAKARLDELKITLAHTVIPSPVDGFVGKRYLDPGAFVNPNAPVASVVDIRTVRLVANLVERDVKRVRAGTPGRVEVDAFPGETFSGKVSRVAPIFDPATRTAEMEIEVPNPGFRLKPGMYARVNLTVDTRPNALTVPRNALVNIDGREGVFVAGPSAPAAGAQPGSERSGQAGGSAQAGAAPASRGTAGAGGGDQPVLIAKFLPVQTGLRDGEQIEITSGLNDGASVITTGATALKDGDRIVVAASGRAARGERANNTGGGEPRSSR
jgi:RND family efflux transporter MFP subunit